MKRQQQFLKSRMIQWIGIGLLVSLFSVNSAFSQALTGTKTIPGDYTSIVIAIDSLNAYGVGSGGVTFNIAGGYTETITKSLIVTATGTLADPIVFQRSGGVANPIITSYAGTKLASSTDSIDVIWAFEGSDFVTINGIDLLDATANITPTTMMEVGYGFYKLSDINGANNNTIQNCSITLNRNNFTSSTGPRANAAGSVAIEFVNCTRQLVGTAITVTATSGASSYNKIYSNTIQNCNFGVSLSGYAAPSPYTTLGDVSNDIGGLSALTGNTIINFGGGTSATNSCGAVYINNQWSANISNNTVNNNTGAGANHPVSNRGIWLYSSSIGASCDVNSNIITITGGASTTLINWCIDVEMAQTGASGNTINVNNNQFLNCKVTVASTAAFTAIWLNTGATTVNANNNYVHGYSYAGTGVSQVILSQLACGTLNILNNTIDSTVLTGTTVAGTHYNIGVTTAPSVAVNINGNNITQTVLNASTTGTKTLYGIYTTGATPSINILDNIIDGISRNGTSGGPTIGIYQNAGTNGVSTARVKRNRVCNISISGTGGLGIIYGIQTQIGTIICDSNTIFNLSCLKTTASEALYGIYNASSPNNENYNYNTIYDLRHDGSTGTLYGINTSTSSGVRTVSNNSIYNLIGTGTVAGIAQAYSTPSVFNNKIYNLTTNSTTTSILSGIVVSQLSSGTAKIYNNVISELFAPFSNGGTSETVRGINLTAGTASTTVGVYFNTININATSIGINFSTTGIYHAQNATATSFALDLRSNIIVNTSTANGTGYTSAYRRSAPGFGNMTQGSNNNLFYAGTPSAKKVLYSDGTNFEQTMAGYKTRAIPRDSLSVTENPVFLSTTGSSPLFLMIDSTTTVTEIEAGGTAVAGITKDYLGNTRAGNLGYTGTSGAPDMGAYEGTYLGNSLNQMIFDSANADQQTGIFVTGTNDVRILRVRVYAEKGYNALEATSFELSTSSTTSIADLTNAKVYYTGSDATFSTTQLFGTATPSTTYTITGSKRLAPGVNYFWVTYDVASGATGGNFIDAAVNNIVLNGTPVSLINGDPAGNIQIKARLNGPYDIGPSGHYTSLTAAATDLAAVGVSGPVVFTLKTGLYDETTGEVFPIVFTNHVGSSTVNTVTIVPDAGVAATITSTHATSTIDLSGVSNIIIDGRPIGSSGFTLGSNLTIANTTATGAALRLFNDADSNTIIYTDLRAANAATAGAATAGVVNIGTTTGTTGNDNNTFRYCDIHATATGFPGVGISAIGTAPATSNDRNTIEDCNIYDFYMNTSPSAGLYVGANNSSWIIKRNNVYQTAKRTYLHTAVVTHRGFWITPNTADLTTASGFVIDSNYIGGNAADGSGLYEMSGTPGATVGFQFVAMEVSVGKGALTTIQGNTITNINDSSLVTGSTACVGFNLSGGKINCNGNFIGSRTINGAITFTTYSATNGGFMGIRTGIGIGTSTAIASTDTINLTNNIISGIDLIGNSTTTAPEFFGFNISTGIKVNLINNMIGDTTLANSINVLSLSTSSATVQRVSGIFANSATANHSYKIFNNTIANITNGYESSTTVLSATRGIYVGPTVAGTDSVVGNTIKNIRTASRVKNSGAASTLGGVVVDAATSTSQVVIGNVIHSLFLTNISVLDTINISGLVFNSNTTGNNLVSGNFIHSLSMAAANPNAVMTGLNLVGGNGIATNNMIRLGIDAAGLDIIAACSIRGITKNAGSASVYFNTVYIGGNGVGADNNRTYAFQRSGAGTDNVRNNIFINNRTNASTGSAGHFAVGLNNNTGMTMNYNLLKADTIGLYNTTSLLTMANWKSGSLLDANSISAVVNFKNTTGSASTVDMHIDTGFAAPIEAYGTSLSGTGTILDFDGETRSNLTPHDLGADAGDFRASDIGAPAITHTALVNTISTGDRILTATIVDATGVYHNGTFKPRVYFKKSFAGSWSSNAGDLTAGTTASGTWQFTIGEAAMGGLLADDSVYYYITAQDSTPFNTLGSFPSGAEGTDVNNISVEPNLLRYKITPILSGPYLVGAGNPFTTLTGTSGLFNYINTAVISGDITIQITSDIEEPGTFALNQTVESGIGGYKINIVPFDAVEKKITGLVETANSALIRLEGADRVTINGNYNGSGRFLRITNRSAIGNTINLANDADNDTIANCIVEGRNTAQATICFYANAIGGTGNDSNAIIGCEIRDTAFSVASNVPNSAFYSNTGNNDYNTFKDNEVYNFAYNGVNISSTNQNYWTITNNKFYQIIAKNLTPVIITVAGGSGHIISDNSIGGSAPDRSGPAYTSNSGALMAINIGSTVTNTNPITISGNTISNMAATGSTNSLKCLTVAGGNVIVSDNTFGGAAMTYDTLRNSGDGAVIELTGGTATVSNNIISDFRYYGGTASYKHTGIYIGAGTHIVQNNSVRKIEGNNATTTPGSTVVSGIHLGSGTNHIIRGNTIDSIRNTNTGTTVAYSAVGMAVISGTTATIESNRIYNISASGQGLGATAPNVIGIFTSGTAAHSYYHNQISVGGNAGGESKVSGFRNSATSGVSTYYNNSVFISGQTAAGANNSFGLERTAGGTVNAFNNIFYNKRTTVGTGGNFAVGSSTAITASNLNYNLLVTADTNAIALLGVTPQGWAALNTLYTASPNTNWAATINDIPTDSLFTDTLVGDLGIITNNTHAWYVNGKGIARTGLSGDFNNLSGVRSTTLATGSTDIGSVEFTPTTLPPVAVADKAPAVLDSTQFFFASRLIAKANWDAGTVPSTVNVRYYSGVTPANTSGKTSMNAYWNIEETGGSGYSYGLTLMADSAVLGTVSGSNNLAIARYTGSAWDSALTTVNGAAGFMSATGRSAVGIFTGTDVLNNPLPVTLTSLTATVNAADVLVAWSTASEINNAGFDVERSVDGKRFEKIGFVKGAGNSNTLNSYTLTDAKAFAKTNSNQLYYRLKQVDLNGASTYSKMVIVTLAKGQQATANIYPNPFIAEYSVNFTANQDGQSTIELVDIQGKKVNIQTSVVTKGMNTVTVNNLEGLQSGIYFVKVTVNGETQVMKLVKQ